MEQPPNWAQNWNAISGHKPISSGIFLMQVDDAIEATGPTDTLKSYRLPTLQKLRKAHQPKVKGTLG